MTERPIVTDLDASDVVASLTAAFRDLAGWLADGTGTLDDRVRLHALLGDAAWGGLMAQAQQEVGKSLAADLDGPIVVDGRVWKPARKLSKREPNKDWLRGQVSRLAVQPKLIAETGELCDPTPTEVVERMWTLAEPAMGRTAAYAKVGIDIDDAWVVREWRDVVEEG